MCVCGCGCGGTTLSAVIAIAMYCIADNNNIIMTKI